MAKIRLQQLCKDYLERRTAKKIILPQKETVNANQFYLESRTRQVHDIVSAKKPLSAFLLKMRFKIFRISPKGVMRYKNYSSFKEDLLKNHLYFELEKNKSLLDFTSEASEKRGRMRTKNTFGQFCERGMSPFFQKKKSEITMTFSNTKVIVGRPDFESNANIYEFKAPVSKDNYVHNLKLAICQTNAYLMLRYLERYKCGVNSESNLQQTNNTTIRIDIFCWYNDTVDTYTMKLDPALANDILFYRRGKRQK